MNETLQFATRGEFRAWLEDHSLSEEGVWLILGKAGGPKTIKAGEALEEALCFGWIDGQMQSLDDKTYRKYFSQRRGKRHRRVNAFTAHWCRARTVPGGPVWTAKRPAALR